MVLYKIAIDKWTVLAVAKSNDEIPLLDFLFDETKSEKDKKKMLVLLRERVPTHGPPANENSCSFLRDEILEFKTGSKGKGPKVRVLWFYDENHQIVCTHGFLKYTQKTPKQEIDKAIEIKNEYFDAKAKDGLRIEDLTKEE